MIDGEKHMRELDINEIHKGTLTIIKEFIHICEDNQLTYFTAYGSLIGTIRHGGFIPWDDDFDVHMFRSDYDKFISYCISHEKELYPFKIYCPQNIKDYPYNIARFCDMRYKLVSTNSCKNDGMGMFIDIYPLDGAGNGKYVSSKFFSLKNAVLISLVSKAGKNKLVNSQSGFHKITYPIAYGFSKVIGLKNLLNLLQKQGKKYAVSESDFVSVLVWTFYPTVFPKEWFSDVIYKKFEDISIAVPIGYESLLSLQYGDYMKLPPEKDRKPQHEYKLYEIN